MAIISGFSVCTRLGMPSARKELQQDRAAKRGKEEPVISAGAEPRRDYTLSHTVRRAALFGLARILRRGESRASGPLS